MATDTSDKKDAAPSAVVKDIEKPVEPKPVETVVSPIMTSVEENTPQVENVAPDLSQPTDPTIIDTVDMGYTKTSSNKMLYVLVGVLALILISLVALFFYRQYTNTPEIGEVTPTPTAEVTVEKPSPSVTPTNDEDAQLQNIIIEDIDADVASIEADMEEL